MNNFYRFYLAFCLMVFVGIETAFAQDPDIESDERSALEDIFRSSDHEGELPTAFRERQNRHKKRVSVPEGATRIGCACMDGSSSEAHSAGACSGSGGVRFWLYRTLEGDTVKVLTGRHERHPHPLDSAELSETNRPKPKKASTNSALQPLVQPIFISPYPANQLSEQPIGDAGWFDWSDAAAITGGGLSLYLILRLLLGWIHTHQTLVRYALRHLLRFGKRPPPRKNRKNPTKTGL
jgi:hypothetical protein